MERQNGFLPMSNSSLPISTLGTPRIGPRRELKFALESFWAGKSNAAALNEAAVGLRTANWARQNSLGVTNIPSNDFSLYDHVLDTAVMVGAIPKVYSWEGGEAPLKTYFAMARGSQETNGKANGVSALEMTKWFDTNYHYVVPEFSKNQEFTLVSSKPVKEYREAKALGFETRPVLVGPVTFLKLGKSTDPDLDPITLLDGLLPVYVDVLRKLQASGITWVQMDEPCLVLDLDDTTRQALMQAYTVFARTVSGLKLMVTSYFGELGDNLNTAIKLPVAGLHLDLVRGPEQIDPVLAKAPSGFVLSLGVIDGRNIWRANLPQILDRIEPVIDKYAKDCLEVAPSCSLLHVPIDLELETGLDPDLKNWLAFSVQKMGELAVLGKALASGRDAVKSELEASAEAAKGCETSAMVHNPRVIRRAQAVTPEMTQRKSEFDIRRRAQAEALKLPPFPTTTIGSFPQTSEVRKARAAHTKGTMSDSGYTTFLRNETKDALRWQEDIGLDVLVHGEFERNDMVQYFGEQLSGYAFTKHGWVQSYGSRYVRPPIIFGDVSRPNPMTVEWATYAQSLTDRPVKGMLTGPVTMLQWSFVRDDIARAGRLPSDCFGIAR